MKRTKCQVRLNNFLSQAGIAARRKCDQLIKDGFVKINSVVEVDPGINVDPDVDTVFFKNKRVVPNNSFQYVLLNKPGKVVCTTRDTRNRKTVIDLVKSDRRIFPVGRLDMSTTGLLLLTNDGELSYRLSHPKFAIDKIYTVQLHKSLTERDIRQLKQGVTIGKNETVSALVRITDSRKNEVEVTVHEGKKNMIKRMFNVLGYKVSSLDRINYAGLTKRKLPRSGWRFLTQSEVRKLRTLVGIESGH